MPCLRESECLSVTGLFTRRPARPPADSRRGSNPVFHKLSASLDIITVLATEQLCCVCVSVTSSVTVQCGPDVT
jgi:hypothetical protein